MYLDSAYHADCCACTGCASHSFNGSNTSNTTNVAVIAGAVTEYTYSMDLSQTSFRGDFEIADFEQAVREALATWSSVANVNFTEASGAGAPSRSHIYIETTSDPVSGAPSSWGAPGGVIGYGGTRFFDDGGRPVVQRFAWQDDAENWSPYGDGGLNYWLVAVHEIGHAIGLAHNSNGLQAMNPSLGRQEGIYGGDIAAVIDIYGAREWTDGADNIFLPFVQVGQTVEAFGGDDTILATDFADTIYGGAGDDDITTNGGNDRIFDTLGDNTVDAGGNNDVVIGGSGELDVEGGSGNDIIIGGKGDDRLSGGNGNDTIRGDAQSSFFHGDDVIIAGGGNDFLEGGGGSDTFVFRTGEGTNTIAELQISGTNPGSTTAIGADFESGVDVIDLRGFGFSSRAEAFSNVSDVGGHARFSDQGTTIIFHGLETADLSQNDFLI